jgi:hypothetical protein
VETSEIDNGDTKTKERKQRRDSFLFQLLYSANQAGFLTTLNLPLRRVQDESSAFYPKIKIAQRITMYQTIFSTICNTAFLKAASSPPFISRVVLVLLFGGMTKQNKRQDALKSFATKQQQRFL